MELKNVNPNGQNIEVSNLINVNFLKKNLLKIELKNRDYMLFFL